MRLSSGVCLTLLLSSSFIATAQQIPPSILPAPVTNASSFTPNSANRRLALDVVVTDKSGKPISGLQTTDFTLLDDKRPQKIESFDAVDPTTVKATPVQVIFVVDEVNTYYQNVAFERQEIQKFLSQNGGHLAEPTSLILFSDAGAKIENGTSLDGNYLSGLLNQNGASIRAINRSAGVYGDEERLQMSLRAINQISDYEATQPGKKLLIWISPGWPLLTGPNLDLGTKTRNLIFKSIVSLSTKLRQARVTLYNIDPSGMADAATLHTEYYREFIKGVDIVKRANIANLGLQVLAEQTGGRVLNSSNDIAGEITRCASDANAYYILSFDTVAPDGPNEYHALEVKVDKPGLIARTRMGYYNQP